MDLDLRAGEVPFALPSDDADASVSSAFLANETFQSTTFPPAGWTRFRGPNDTQSTSATGDWVRRTTAPCTTANACASAAFNSAGATERYLVTPQVTPTATAYALTFKAGQSFTDNFDSQLQIRVSTTTATGDAFTTTLLTLTEANLAVAAFNTFSVDLSAYIGTPIYVAFVHVQNDADTIILDDVAITEPVPASFTSTTLAFQNTAASYQGQESFIVGAQVVVGGNFGSVPLTSISFTTTGTTNTADLASARLLYTAASTSFSLQLTPQFGTPVVSPSGTITFTGSQALQPGNNNFILVYGIAPGATIGNVIDATYAGATVGGTPRTPTATTVTGASTIAAPPPNNNLANARVVMTTPYSNSQSNAGATLEPNEAPATCAFNGLDGSQSIWWSYTPSTSGSATFASSGFDTIQALYTGTTFPLTQVACADNGTGETFTFAVTAGTRYYFRVTGYNGAVGTAAVTITGPAPLVSVSQQLSNGAGYRLLSAPATGVTVGTLAGINLVQGVVGQYPGGTNPVGANILLDLDATGYVRATDVANPVTPGRGFFWYFYDQNITPQSDASNGGGTSQSYTLATRPLAVSGTVLNANTTVTYPASGTNTFHMAGNPFATAMTADGVTGDVAIQNDIQIYSPTSGFSVVPRTAATTLSTWQGFFVEQTTAGTALTVTYDATKRVAGNGTIVGRPAASREVALALTGQAADGTTVVDEAAVIRVTDEATTGWDADDASKLTPPAATYALLAPVGERDGAAYRQAVLSRPASDLADVTLAFTATHAGTYTITAEATGMPSEATVRDLMTGTVTPLAQGYTFTSDATDWTERFVVSFGRTTAGEGTAVAEFALAAPSPNPTSGSAVVTFDVPSASSVSVAVYDLLGRRVAVLAEGEVAAGRHTARLDAGTFAPGVYVVRMQAGTFAATQRVTVVR